MEVGNEMEIFYNINKIQYSLVLKNGTYSLMFIGRDMIFFATNWNIEVGTSKGLYWQDKNGMIVFFSYLLWVH